MGRIAVIENGVVINTIECDETYLVRLRRKNPDLIFKESEEANVTYIYLEEKDTFVRPKPDVDFVLDEEKLEWIAPKEVPDENQKESYYWDKEIKDWVEMRKGEIKQDPKDGAIIKEEIIKPK